MKVSGQVFRWLALFLGLVGAAGAAEEVVKLAPVHVSVALASLELRLFYLPNSGSQNPSLSFLRIETVRPNSAAARAGVAVGMEILAIQGLRIRGLTDFDLNKAMGQPVKDEIVLTVREPSMGTMERSIRIPLHAPAAPATKKNP